MDCYIQYVRMCLGPYWKKYMLTWNRVQSYLSMNRERVRWRKTLLLLDLGWTTCIIRQIATFLWNCCFLQMVVLARFIKVGLFLSINCVKIISHVLVYGRLLRVLVWSLLNVLQLPTKTRILVLSVMLCAVLFA